MTDPSSVVEVVEAAAINQVTIAGPVCGRPQRRTIDEQEVVQFAVALNGPGSETTIIVPCSRQPALGVYADDVVLVIGVLGYVVTAETARTRVWDTMARLGLSKTQIRHALERLPPDVMQQDVAEPLAVIQATRVTHIQAVPRRSNRRPARPPRSAKPAEA
ncbi:MAG: hypothetical protein KJ734_04095 [Chloroflexi bacterium]|nr:hypothetical protein [Chloroflexota bacterium]